MRYIVILLLVIGILAFVTGRYPNKVQAQRTLVTYSYLSRAFAAECEWCHGWKDSGRASGYFMSTYQARLDGAYKDGVQYQEIIPGDAQHSPFVEYLEGRRQPRMPYERDPWDRTAIEVVRRWIDDGAKADSETASEHKIVLDHIPVDRQRNSFWLSCRKTNEDIILRVKVIDEFTPVQEGF